MSDPEDDDYDVDEMFARVMDVMPPYEGKDPNTSDDWYCKRCYKREGQDGAHLRTCARCRAVRYCSVDCQRRDFNDKHREECREIHDLTKKMRQQAEELRHHRGWFGNEEEHDLFQTNPGHFWGILDTRDYCRTRYELQSRLGFLAHRYEVRPLLEKVLGHQLELLRLMASDNLGLRDVVPFTLLSLNRDDDAYAFIRYWVPILQDGPDVTGRHENTSPGDWIYPRGQDKREDVLEVFNCTEKYFSLAFLAALCIIKLRMIGSHADKKKQMNTFSKTKMGRALGDALEHVDEARTNRDGEAAMIEEQERHVGRYFRVMQENNPSLLPSIVKPGPLKSQPAPAYVQPGTPSEAWQVLNRCNRHFVRIPGVQDRIEGIVGKNPTYEYLIHPDLQG